MKKRREQKHAAEVKAGESFDVRLDLEKALTQQQNNGDA